MKIVHVPVYHECTFQAILAVARQGSDYFRYAGRYWEPIEQGRGFSVYRRASYNLDWIQQRVEDYENYFYRRLLQGYCGRDGAIRPRSRLRKGTSGVYKPAHKSDLAF